jgi:hypothetical protein
MDAASVATLILGALLVLLVAVFVAAPLFRTPEVLAPEALPGARERWERQKQTALAAIKEIELDHQMGKLSDEDLATMRGRFEVQALEAMAALDREEKRS